MRQEQAIIAVTNRFLDALNQLHDHRVEFVIVGGVAAVLHGATRVTFDLGVVPRLAPEPWGAVDLIEMKQRASRPQDLLDMEQLRDVQRRTR